MPPFSRWLSLIAGSSPHARGARTGHPVHVLQDGIIPACAGSTGECYNRRIEASTPRPSNRDTARFNALNAGSSPHARGALLASSARTRDISSAFALDGAAPVFRQAYRYESTLYATASKSSLDMPSTSVCWNAPCGVQLPDWHAAEDSNLDCRFWRPEPCQLGERRV